MSAPMNSMFINKTINSKDWYFAQGLSKPEGGYFATSIIILAKNIVECKEKAKSWQKEVGFKDLYLYKNNYKRDARDMLSRGQYI